MADVCSIRWGVPSSSLSAYCCSFFFYISSHLLILCLSDVTNLNFWISVNTVSVFSGGSGNETTLWWPAVMQWPVVSAASNWNTVPSARGKLGQVQLLLLLTCNLINERNNTRRSCVAIFFPSPNLLSTKPRQTKPHNQTKPFLPTQFPCYLGITSFGEPGHKPKAFRE